MGNLRLDMKIGDRRPQFRTPILDGDVAISLSGATAALKIQRPDGSAISKTMTVETPASAGIVYYDWVVGDLPTVGDYRFEVEITFGDGTKQTFPARGTGIISVHEDLD